MLLTFVVILLVIGASVVGSIYSGFLTFYRSFDETENYNKAYYASIGALERAELAIRQRGPGYEGDGGRQDGTNTGSSSELGTNTRDGINNSSGLSYLNFNPTSNLFWSIKAKTDTIPSKGNGDVDWTIFSGDSIDYNKMDYENAEIFLLYYDSGSNSPYDSGGAQIQRPSPSSISGTLRLPETVKEKFGLLDHSLSNSNIKNAPIVDWQIRGKYQSEQFTIYSFSDTNIHGSFQNHQIQPKDSVIRESDINSGSNNENNINFGSSKSPVSKKGGSDTNPERTIISSKDAEISGSANNFYAVFTSGAYTGLQLRMSLLNLLKTGDVVYPYLEYKLNFGEPVTDKYYTIDAEGKLGDYKVNLIVQKPTIRESVYGNFTVIF